MFTTSLSAGLIDDYDDLIECSVGAGQQTPDKESLKIALQKMYSNGGTSFSAALNASIKQIDSAEKITNGANKNRIILLSDGDDNDYASRRNAAIQKCKDKFIEVYTVGFGSANDAILQNIADKTGGKYYKAMNAQDIVDIFAKFGYMDDFDMTDTDGDGLPDAVEAAGIRLQNGKLLRDVDSDGIIFTDPANPDTDGDGLLDGKEIDPTPQLHTIPEFALPSSSCGPVQSKPSYYFMAISDPRKKDSDGDGYDDIADSNPLFKDYYCFLDNESYSFACVNKKPYPKYKIAQNESGFLSTVEAFGDEFKFLWTANGYVITHVPTSKKLTIDVNGKISLKETNTITDNQLWEVVQYKADNTGIVIKSKVYLLSDGKYYPQYLCYRGEAIAVSNSIDEARLMPVYSSSALPFGYVYMSYLKWIDNGVLASYHSQSLSNYLHNMTYSFEGFINGQSIHESSKAMKFGGYTDGYNACGWVSIYNACLLNDMYVHPKDIIWFLEVNNYMIFNGAFGCLPNGIRDFFSAHNVQVNGTLCSGISSSISLKGTSKN